MVSQKVGVLTCGQMAKHMRANGLMVSNMAKVPGTVVMEKVIMKVIGKKASLTVMEYINGLMAINIEESFLMVSNMDKGKRNFIMAIITKVVMPTVNQKMKESIFGQMGAILKVLSKMGSDTE